MIALTRRYRFPAAHVLRHPDLSDAENDRVYGKCAHPSGHGHDYGLEVTVAGPVDPRTGAVVALEELDALVHEHVLDRFSHVLLNDLEPFHHLVPTAENIAQVIHEALSGPVSARSGASLLGVRLVETRRNWFDYGAAA
ncbi:MAG: 6-carboxytetrahydropterin synthase [Myxococcota bacterium]